MNSSRRFFSEELTVTPERRRVTPGASRRMPVLPDRVPLFTDEEGWARREHDAVISSVAAARISNDNSRILTRLIV